ncbi:5-formyltetrahydrofolate cyclo-ligase [Candidatus Sumerlaeota bacterium]|nr:5-formyltetrahydrofolate cyclo-ligase [Candidatus Sumerlaeota bacterium]
MEGNSLKRDLRRQARERRAAIPVEKRRVWDAYIGLKLLTSDVWARCRSVLAYCSMPDEVSTRAVIERALREERTLFLPRCIPGEKRFEAVEIRDPEKDLVSGPLPGLMEPRAGLPTAADPNAIDLIVVPGVAFDPRGYRLGFGVGMYDRFLSAHPLPHRLAFAYEIQILDAIPESPHDVPVHAVQTESRRIEPGKTLADELGV